MIYNMYIFDRHCQCIYYHDWHRGHTAKTAFENNDPLASHPSGGGSTTTTTTMTDPRQGMNMSLEEEGKLVYGVVYSLRNLVKKLGRSQDGFIAYKTSHYKLHYYETLTGLKFVLNSDPGVESLQAALRQIYTQIYVELVVKNPLARASLQPGQINPETMGAEGFRNGVDRFVRSLTMFETL
ncbi:trafficking protein particle complex subunit 1 [Entomortierella parvispora]|uniref:Trafficking protein particle complex subunit n=1 Tax=Entomortierella parvispora TaxID=205924 RepID=A0A9P3LYP0_9FUNG|nr:trafficking protein particle complex subunit 1 [Entomortierella parvispora]